MRHGGVAYLQERFWILKGQQVVRKIIMACVICLKFEDTTYPTIPAPDLPYERVFNQLPFTHTGVVQSYWG